MQNRAKIFMPFDALNGFKDALKREEELHENKFSNKETILDKIKKLNKGDRIEITYFYNFETIISFGEVKGIDYRKKIIKVSNSIIDFDSIDEIKKRL
ncbi:MAG: hypothetical protein IJH20_02470 [Bacilli bacterium]|nr:hypothetical protein [Bacilli bacterium]